MNNDILVSDESYIKLRQDARNTLGRFGIGTNPGFTDHNILCGLSAVLGTETPEVYDEWSEYSAELFRDSLASVLGIELPTNPTEVGFTLAQIRR